MIIIPVATRQELDACLAIRMEVFVNEQQVPFEEELDEYDVSPEACHHVLMTDGDKPVATGRWKVYEDGTAKLQRIAVLKEYRGGGTGRLLMEALEDSARQAGMKRAILDGQCHAEGFYKKQGYQTISTEPFLDAGILHVRMVKEL
ncbi:GNAT family N-acetyltransferase [Paenibacillus sp. YN15]|uniref:GNAT family N-acetyltransferase n=1 Tax=Paenibacillus sp. YN15 TaxID=1742774 RepID=UPI000DCEB370|nr:GNAT family N-acetyltransferase [Paenibacillus sp. YN15]RAV05444.1 GNAT family N-acetyltransferase [Paenibacillus sp. YN15]